MYVMYEEVNLNDDIGQLISFKGSSVGMQFGFTETRRKSGNLK